MLKLWHQPIEQENTVLAPLVLDAKSVLLWETCRRKIYFFIDETALIAEGRGFKQGLEAEAFLLEVLCGLHSPVMGETEILGQFRQFIQVNSEHAWVQKFYPRTQSWFSFVKEVREKYLCSFGSQSYGGYLRRLLYNHTQVQIIGAGSLVEDMLPWLKTKSVHVFARNLEKAKIQVTKHQTHYANAQGHLSAHLFDGVMPSSAEALVIAAPLTHDELRSVIAKSPTKWKYVIDLRRDAQLFTDRDPRIESWITLENVMEFFSQQKDLLASRQKQALDAIEKWRLAQLDRVTLRPFGWEDLCG